MSSLLSNSELASRVQRRLDSLTKPRGSLGALEEIVLRIALIQGNEAPSVQRKALFVFCGDHGITEEGVSAYPSEVTAQMAANFVAGGAAINVLCRQAGIQTSIVDVGVKAAGLAGVIDRKVGPGTANFARTAAMTRSQLEQALAAGRQLAEDASQQFDLVGVGEMGIGNTTSASALLCAFTGCDPSEAAGPGAGLTPEQVSNKAGVIRRALELHRPDPSNGADTLAAVGGFEIAAMAGFLLGASATRLPVVLDGFISCSAALAARALDPRALETAFFSHRSAEPGHTRMLTALGASPSFDLGMRLGEGTGAALMMQVIDAAVALYRDMATFESAGVSGA